MQAQREHKLLATIGTGAQGVVWRAESPSGEIVAYKVYKVDADSDPVTDRKRFVAEIRAHSTLSHPNVVSVIEDGVDVNGYPYYVMELAEGSLETRIEESKGGLPRDEALAIFEKICDAMAYAHGQGVLHRDLKPQNVLMYGSEPRVADFGLGRDLLSAKKTYTQSTFPQGSFGYMAPEQMRSLHDAEQPADVYAMGKILYRMLTGADPLTVQLDRVPADLQYVIHASINEDPGERFKDCGELLNRLRDVVGADSSLLAPPADRVKAAVSAVLAGDTDALQELGQVLMSFPDDSTLYLKALPRIPKPILAKLTKLQPANVKTIVKRYDDLVAENGSFDYADVVADFLDPVFRNTDDIDLRKLILIRLLDQGYRNNRFHVGGVFADLCSSVWSQPIYAQIIADLLLKRPAAAGFAAEYVTKLSMPAVVAAALPKA